MEPAIAIDSPMVAAAPAVALSADGRHLVVVRHGELVVGDVRTKLRDAVVAAVLEREVWCVAHGASGHRLERIGLDGAQIGEATPLGELGDDVCIAAARRGQHALVSGTRELELRADRGGIAVADLGPRRRDARILVPGRGVIERRAAALVLLRAGTIAELSLALPAEMADGMVVGGGLVLDGAMIVIELAVRGQHVLLTYDARRGGIQSRVRISEAAVLASAERVGMVVIGRERHLALLDLRRGRCCYERVLATPACSVAIDASGERVVVVDALGQVCELGAMHDDAAVPDEPVVEAPVVEAPIVEAPVVATPVAVERVTHDAAFANEPLVALRPCDDVEPWSRDALDGYLAALRGWVAAMARTAIAVAYDTGRLGNADVDALLVARSGLAAARVAEARAAEAEATDALAEWSTDDAPHVALARDLGLGELALRALLLAAAPQIWGELVRVYGVLSGDPARAVVDELLLAQLLAVDAIGRAELARELDAAGALARAGAIEIGKQPRPYASIAVHSVVVRRLVGERFEASADEPLDLDEVVAPREAVAALLAALAAPADEPVRVVVRGRPNSGRRTLAAALAARAGRELVAIAPVAGTDAELALVRALQDASLRGLVPCVALDDVAEDPELLARIRRALDAHPAPLFVRAPLGRSVPLAPGHHAIELRPLAETARRDAWAGALALRDLPVELADRLAARFSVGPGVIERACDHAASVGGDDPERALVDAIRQHRSARLGTIATRCDRLADWDSLVLPPDILDGMRELVSRVSHRRTVLETWGMERVAATARGVTALFQGGPGTGKTMAAGALAHALGYELWRVDLSKVMSRWLGETEKNLGAVFDAAEDGEVVLLFDEADSLFGKRTEVKSSHDRYANLEVNYLLQRLDEFSGVAVLTTNFGTAIDPAFKRRLSLHAQFPFPDESDRERLWRAHLPASVPIAGELDLAGLAHKFQLSGGLIRNAALRAAYLAAAEQGAVSNDHLVRAVRLEYLARGQLGDGRLE